ncbi:MAG: lamin tail domain-containing protein [Fodinibius sp.]|nr:lamin tail domain-containing protein [Fodinibius sp.]
MGPCSQRNRNPGSENNIPSDNEGPHLVNLTVGSGEVTLTFSEQLDPSTATTVANYTLSNGPAITNARFATPDTVILQVKENLQNNTTYTLSIQNVSDIFSNQIAATDTSFTYYEVSSVAQGDIFVNEFMYDPPSGSVEYIELYNPTQKSLDIRNWTLNDDSGSRKIISNTQYIIPPDSFVVISAGRSLQTNYPDIALVDMGNDFPSLNNDDDAIVVRNQNGTKLDSLTYNNSWGGNERTLERRSVEVAGTFQSNWDNASNGFGTPGQANGVQPDTQSPTLQSLAIQGNTEIALTFSEQLQVEKAEEPGNYSLSGSPSIQNISYTNRDSVYLTLDQQLQNATDYTLSVENISDIFGNSITATDTTFTFYEISPADSGDVFVNEFSYEPSSGSTEYIELYNPTNRSFNLKDWTLADNRHKLRYHRLAVHRCPRQFCRISRRTIPCFPTILIFRWCP